MYDVTSLIKPHERQAISEQIAAGRKEPVQLALVLDSSKATAKKVTADDDKTAIAGIKEAAIAIISYIPENTCLTIVLTDGSLLASSDGKAHDTVLRIRRLFPNGETDSEKVNEILKHSLKTPTTIFSISTQPIDLRDLERLGHTITATIFEPPLTSRDLARFYTAKAQGVAKW